MESGHAISSEGDRRSVPPSSMLVFGMASGLLMSVLLQPLDRLKTLSQQFGSTATGRNGRKLSGVTLLIDQVRREGGVLALWRGLTPTLIRVVPGVAMHFTIVESLRPHVLLRDGDGTVGVFNRYFLLGFGSRCLVATVMQPATLIKTLRESSLTQHRESISELVRRGGLLALWRGLTPTLLRDAPFSGLYLMFYRFLLHRLSIPDEKSAATTSRAFCGMLAGALACLITHPFDALKTAVQLYPEKFQSRNILGVVVVLHKERGIGAFFRGFVPRALRRTLSAALSWALFDEMIARRRTSLPE